MSSTLRVTVWNEFEHEKSHQAVIDVYPDGIHKVIADGLKKHGFENVRTATLDQPEHGLTEEVLANTDVLTWWGHMAHNKVDDKIVERVHERVLQGMGLIVKVPLDSGWLSGRYRGNHKFDDVRSRWSPEILKRRSDLVEKFAMLVPEGTSMAHAALQFVLAQPEVSTVIPGAKTVEQALDNFIAADKQLNAETIQAMRDLWTNEIEANPLPW